MSSMVWPFPSHFPCPVLSTPTHVASAVAIRMRRVSPQDRLYKPNDTPLAGPVEIPRGLRKAGEVAKNVPDFPSNQMLDSHDPNGEFFSSLETTRSC